MHRVGRERSLHALRPLTPVVDLLRNAAAIDQFESSPGTTRRAAPARPNALDQQRDVVTVLHRAVDGSHRQFQVVLPMRNAGRRSTSAFCISPTASSSRAADGQFLRRDRRRLQTHRHRGRAVDGETASIRASRPGDPRAAGRRGGGVEHFDLRTVGTAELAFHESCRLNWKVCVVSCWTAS